MPNKFHKDMNIGEIVKASPEAEKVIAKHFGMGCFTCPGMKMESVAFGAMMHGLDADKILQELNSLPA